MQYTFEFSFMMRNLGTWDSAFKCSDMNTENSELLDGR